MYYITIVTAHYAEHDKVDGFVGVREAEHVFAYGNSVLNAINSDVNRLTIPYKLLCIYSHGNYVYSMGILPRRFMQ